MRRAWLITTGSFEDYTTAAIVTDEDEYRKLAELLKDARDTRVEELPIFTTEDLDAQEWFRVNLDSAGNVVNCNRLICTSVDDYPISRESSWISWMGRRPRMVASAYSRTKERAIELAKEKLLEEQKSDS